MKLFWRKALFLAFCFSAFNSQAQIDKVCQTKEGFYAVPKSLDDAKSFDSLILIRQQIKILFDRELQLLSRLTPGTREFNLHWSRFYSKWNSTNLAPIYKFDRENQVLIPSERGTLNLRVSQIGKLKTLAEDRSQAFNSYRHQNNLPMLALFVAAAKFYSLREIPPLSDLEAWEQSEFVTNLYPEIVSNPKIPALANSLLKDLRNSSVVGIVQAEKLNSSAAFDKLIVKIGNLVDENELRGARAQELHRLFLSEFGEIIKYFDKLLIHGLKNPRSLFDNGMSFAINAWDSLNTAAVYDRDRLKTLFCENEKYRRDKNKIIHEMIAATDITVTVLGFSSLGFGIASWAVKRAGMTLLSKVLNYSMVAEIVVGLPMLTVTAPLEISQALARYQNAANGYYIKANGTESEEISQSRGEILKTIGSSTVDFFTYLPGIFFLKNI